MAFTDDQPGLFRDGQPDYRRESTAEQAAAIARQPGEPLPPSEVVTRPDIAGLHPDPDVARRPGPECRDSAGLMDTGRTARALGLPREQVEAAIREQAACEAQLAERAQQEIARRAAAGGPELADAELGAETGRLAEAYPEPVQAPGEEPGVDAARWIPGQEYHEPGAARSPIDRDAQHPLPAPGYAEQGLWPLSEWLEALAEVLGPDHAQAIAQRGLEAGQ